MKKYKRWKRFYMILMIMFGILIPVELMLWLAGSESFPLASIGIGATLYAYRKHHLQQMESQMT
ncbi:hypothetical protein [Jeotgalibacillus terrae]|uniref:Uncharacterized protein n=1 Tax=Jeotgalibacillus terrae TaxID=587735 RepID=A0ABW5ZLZ1_9BACL|nr:hypothetical protein [Jeotgalibacillus terrae]MBM7581064.1 hypothetical protein [Jeotgalibacillus terrae]